MYKYNELMICTGNINQKILFTFSSFPNCCKNYLEKQKIDFLIYQIDFKLNRKDLSPHNAITTLYWWIFTVF